MAKLKKNQRIKKLFRIIINKKKGAPLRISSC